MSGYLQQTLPGPAFQTSYVNTDYLSNVTVSHADAEFANVTGGGYITMGNNSLKQSQLIVGFNGGAGMTHTAGKFTTVYDVAVLKGSTSETCTGFIDKLYYNGAAISDGSVAEFDHSRSLAEIIAVADAWYYDETVSWEAPEDATVLNSYNICLTSTGRQYYDNIEMWYYPANSFMVKDGEALELVTVTEDTYTFPEDDQGKAWRYELTTYKPGDTVNVSELEYKTLTVTENNAEILAILDRHPNAIYISGDTHYTLDTDYHNTVNGMQISPSFVNDGAVIDAWIAEDESDVNNPEWVKVEGTNAMGIIAEVYEDRILLKGRHFVNGKWISRGFSEVTFKEACPIDELTVKRYGKEDGSTVLTAKNGTDSGLTYTWYIDGTVQQTTANTLTVASGSFEYIAVRAQDADGNYRSEVFTSLDEIPEGEAEIIFGDDTVAVEDLYQDAMLVLCAYKNGRISGIKLIPLTASTDMNLSDTGIDMINVDAVTAMLIEGGTLKPLCMAVKK